MTCRSLFWLWMGLTAGNILWQILTQHDFPKAAERSYFQGWAFLLVWARGWRWIS